VIYRAEVRVEAPVRPTEVTDRVRDAVTELFPEAELAEAEGRVVATGHSLDRFSERLREQEILDTARRQFHDGLDEAGFAFRLKKQAAFQGRVNFAVGNPDELGDIEVTVRVEEPDPATFIDHVAPETEEGVPVDELDGRSRNRDRDPDGERR
jgi:hypothetical protein